MASSTSHFVALQRLFAAKAGADVDALGRHAAVLLRAAGRPPGAIPRDAVRLFAKNAAHLAVVRTPPLACEPGGGGEPGSSSRAGALLRALSAEDASRPCAALLLLLRGCDRFHAAVGRFPGTGGGEAEEDAARLRAHAHALLADATAAAGGAAGHPQGAPALPDDLVAEARGEGARLGLGVGSRLAAADAPPPPPLPLPAQLVRAGAAELHCVAAVVGGIAAQEGARYSASQGGLSLLAVGC